MNNTTNDKENNRETNTSNSREGQYSALSGDVTPVRPDHSNARASVYVEGLSVLGFNPITNRAEIGFFRDMHQPVEMKIYNSKCEPVWSTEKVFPPFDTLGMEIKINTTKSGMGSRYEHTPMDDEDFRHLPDLPKWHGASKMNVIPDSNNVFLSARLNICDAVFYTYKLSVSNATKSENNGANPTSLGRIGRIPGADVFCSPTENLEIEILSPNISTPIKISLGQAESPYLIIVRAAPIIENPPMSHLALLYNILEKPRMDPRTFALKFDGSELPILFCDEVGIEATQFECQVFVDSEGGW